MNPGITNNHGVHGGHGENTKACTDLSDHLTGAPATSLEVFAVLAVLAVVEPRLLG